MNSTYENMRELLGAAATERTIQMAVTAVDTLSAAGVSKEVIRFVIDAIACYDNERYTQRQDVIDELKERLKKASKRAFNCGISAFASIG
jgi:hypothetical protein